MLASTHNSDVVQSTWEPEPKLQEVFLSQSLDGAIYQTYFVFSAAMGLR